MQEKEKSYNYDEKGLRVVEVIFQHRADSLLPQLESFGVVNPLQRLSVSMNLLSSKPGAIQLSFTIAFYVKGKSALSYIL